MEPEKGQSELEKLFEGLPDEEVAEGDIFADIGKKQDDQAVAAPAKDDAQVVDDPAKGDEPRKNRRHRRLEKQLQEEREARIRAEALAEGRTSAQSADAGDVPQEWLRMYGDTPESRQAWALNKGILTGFMAQAEENAVKRIQAEQAKQREQEQQFEQFIEEELEDIEDQFNVDVTSDAPAAKKARREFLELVQSLSPKDESGSITGYADFTESWKIYQDKKKAVAPDKSRAKEIASRGLTNSGNAAPEEVKRTPGFFGWQQDLKR